MLAAIFREHGILPTDERVANLTDYQIHAILCRPAPEKHDPDKPRADDGSSGLSPWQLFKWHWMERPELNEGEYRHDLSLEECIGKWKQDYPGDDTWMEEYADGTTPDGFKPDWSLLGLDD